MVLTRAPKPTGVSQALNIIKHTARKMEKAEKRLTVFINMSSLFFTKVLKSTRINNIATLGGMPIPSIGY